MKKWTLILTSILVTVFFSSSLAYSQFSDVADSSIYGDAVKRISALGIMKGYEDGQFKPDNLVTREQFAKVIVSISGMDNAAKAQTGTSIFPDVSTDRWSNSFINVAVANGFVKGMLDGNFHPTENITFAQACTVIIKSLNYKEADVPGIWPTNYIEKARTLGLTQNVDRNPDEALQRWALVLMLDKLRSTNMNKATASEADRTFGDYYGVFSEQIILATSATSEKLLPGQVQTDKSIYYLSNSSIKLEPGIKYGIHLDGDKIDNTSGTLNIVRKITVTSVIGSKISFTENGKTNELTLPDKTVYYYNGEKKTYDTLTGLINTNSSIVFGYNSAKTGYDYAIIFDPQYSKPQVAGNISITDKNIGNVTLIPNERIFKNGNSINTPDIKDKDVIYEITDIWGKNPYITVIDNKIEGILTAVTPSKTNPESITINTTIYKLSKDIDLGKISQFSDLLNTDKTVTILLGKDDKVVDIYDIPTNFAFILNTSSTMSTEEKTKGQRIFNAKLLTGNGYSATYNTKTDLSAFKGNMANFTLLDDNYVDLKVVQRNFYPDMIIDKDLQKLGDSFADDNIKIFNIISNNTGADMVVNILNWNDLPNKTINTSKIIYQQTVGGFGDISTIVFNDLFDENYITVYAKEQTRFSSGSNSSSFTYKLYNGDTAYTYSETVTETNPKDIEIGKVFKAKLQNAAIQDDIKPIIAASSSKTIQLMDKKRVKTGDKVFALQDSAAIYIINKEGRIDKVGVSDIIPNKEYNDISIYLNETGRNQGKVSVIIAKE